MSYAYFIMCVDDDLYEEISPHFLLGHEIK